MTECQLGTDGKEKDAAAAGVQAALRAEEERSGEKEQIQRRVVQLFLWDAEFRGHWGQ